MEIHEATEIVAYLNAAYPREALEAETTRVWVAEMAELRNVEAARQTAKLIARNDDRFPSLALFRRTYRQQADRMRPAEIEEPYERAPLDDDIHEWMAERGLRGWDGVLRDVNTVATTFEVSKLEPRPVWARYLRRLKGSEIGLPTDEERADAIDVLHDNWQGEDGDPRVARALLTEAQRILDEASA